MLTDEAAAHVVHALVTSRLDNCNAILYGLPQSLLNKVQRVQNMAARVLSGSRKFDHITPVLRSLHWLPIIQRIKYKILLLSFKCLHNQAPIYLVELIEQYRPSRALRSGSDGLLTIPKSRTRSFGDRSFSRAAPRLWNSLPKNIRLLSSLSKFKSELKTYLFSEHFK